MSLLKALILFACAMILGACGGAGEPCEQARQHVAACLGLPDPSTAPTACTAQEASRSEQLLALDCAALQASGGKGDGWDREKNVTLDTAVCSPADPTDDCASYCSTVRVETEILGIVFPSCLVSSSCDLVSPGTGRCQCVFFIGACASPATAADER